MKRRVHLKLVRKKERKFCLAKYRLGDLIVKALGSQTTDMMNTELADSSNIFYSQTWKGNGKCEEYHEIQ